MYYKSDLGQQIGILTNGQSAEDSVQRQQAQSSQQTLQTAISTSATILGALPDRKSFSAPTINRAGSTMKSESIILKEKQEVALGKEKVEDLKAQLAELENSLQNEIDVLNQQFDVSAKQFEGLR